jgi:S1-C subfamily serine protease
MKIWRILLAVIAMLSIQNTQLGCAAGGCNCAVTYCGAPCDEYYGLNVKSKSTSNIKPNITPTIIEEKEASPYGLFLTSGTGFVVSKSGYALTNKHVVSSGNKWYAFFKNDTGYVANQIKIVRCLDDDVCLIKLENLDSSITPFVLETNFEVGEEVISLGFPLWDILGFELKVTNGIINSLSGYKGNFNYMQVSCELNPGSSGGPLLNRSGRVIGISSAGIRDPKVKNVNYALKMDYCFPLIKNYIPENSSTEVKSIQEIVRENRRATFILGAFMKLN